MYTKMANILLSVAILAIWLPSIVHSDKECLVFEWKAEDENPFKGMYIKQLLNDGKKIANYTGLENANDCFKKCCEEAELTEECNAASFYPDEQGVNQCYLLKCLPFGDCQWAETAGASSMAGFIYVTDIGSENELADKEKEVADSLDWNIEEPWTGSTEKPQTTTENVEATTQKVVTTEKAETTTATPVKVTTESQEDEQGEDENEDEDEDEDDSWPPAGQQDAGMTAAGDQSVDTGDLINGEGSPYTGDDGTEVKATESHVNVGVVVACTVGAIALLAIVLVVIFKRIQAERDRSIYRPLMDDINSSGTRPYRESDPLH